MIKPGDRNIRMLIHVASHLGDLREKVVFLGGCATGLLITDPAIPEVRITNDVEITSRMEYYRLEEELRKRGFQEDMNDNAPVCRWLIDEFKVDVMPTQEDILGFSNRWYHSAIKNAIKIELEKRIDDPPCYCSIFSGNQD
jgi:hypothetical protein